MPRTLIATTPKPKNCKYFMHSDIQINTRNVLSGFSQPVHMHAYACMIGSKASVALNIIVCYPAYTSVSEEK